MLFDVVIVDGGVIRNGLDDDFALGGNAGRYAYIPDGEIWIEDTGDRSDMAATTLHEAIECHLMVEQGQSYAVAHDHANKYERDMRQAIASGDLAIETETEAAAAVNDWLGKAGIKTAAAVADVDKKDNL